MPVTFPGSVRKGSVLGIVALIDNLDASQQLNNNSITLLFYPQKRWPINLQELFVNP